ncbi:MAG: TldD/PmbA family protein [Bacteroidaceae bacterium]|nr:TldD/PmbA family protein [Bacteroidaceae bacterium]
MNETLHTETAQRAMQAVQHEGCSDARIILMHNDEDTIQVRNESLERLQHATSTSLALNLFIDGREGFFYTNDLRPDALSRFVREAVQATTLLHPDETRTLADPSRYYRGDGLGLDNCDSMLSAISPDEKISLARRTNDQVLGCDHRIICAETHYSDRLHSAYTLISNGFEGYEESSHITLSTIVTVSGDDGRHFMDGWGETRIRFRDMPSEGVAPIALQRALRKIGQRPVRSGNYTMIVESPVAGSLLAPMLAAMNGQAIQQRTSFLANRLGTRVGSSLLHIVDDPHIPGTRGACYFDYDGVATQRRILFDEGRLTTFFIDTPYGNKLRMAPTTQGTHHLIFRPSDKSLHQLMSDYPEAILVTDFNGGNCDPTTGNFSYGIEGFLLNKGEIVQPVSGVNITGNQLRLWESLVGVANDADPWETELIPSLAFDEVAFGGK